MTLDELNLHLEKFAKLKIAVIGDFALDFYFQLEKETGEISIETGKVVHYGSKARTFPGGAGNVVKNLASLQVGEILPLGMVGNDVFGRELKYQVKRLGHSSDLLQIQTENWETITYTKPHFEQVEENRIDFGIENVYSEKSVDQLFRTLEETLPTLQALVINQQFINPLLTPENIQRLNKLVEQHPKVLFIGDLRDHGHLLRGAILKINVEEGMRFSGLENVEESDHESCQRLTTLVHEKTGCQILLTRGASGLSFFDGNQYHSQNGIYIDGPIDTVGAGDSCLSAFIAGMAAQMPVQEALELSNLAAAVTIKKVQETGSATPAEILELKKNYYPTYNLNLATDLRRATYLPDTDIELVETIQASDFKHVIFDHDGTISTLREGWEAVMLPMMVESICGQKAESLSAQQYQAILSRSKDFIDQSTGIQTIVQMQGLAEMVKNEGLVPPEQVKTAAEYKALYLKKLMLNVNQRIERYKRGERTIADFIMKGAVDLLDELSRMGIELYLASGTDEDDVINEATILGYAKLFTGGIYGSKGNEIGDAKKIVIQRILTETGTTGDAILIIGDGPVEIREGRRAGAVCVGIASDEVRRYGLNPSKRTRLIKAGAHLIIPDFTHYPKLLELIEGKV